MEIITNITKIFEFNKNIYLESPIYITNNKFWDGGITCDNSLEEKSSFYDVAKKMSYITKEIILMLNSQAFVGKSLCENEVMFAHWSNLKKHELFKSISRAFHPKKHYKISLPNDEKLIDLIIESNFRYFSYISLYFPQNNLICLPTCHTELLIYTPHQKEVITMLKPLIQKYANEDYKIIYNSPTISGNK